MKTFQNPYLKKVFPFLLFVIFIFSCTPQNNLTGIVEKVGQSLVTVISYDEDGRITNRGCGFFLNQNGDIITARHFIINADSVVIKTAKGETYPIITIKTGYKDLIMINANVPKEKVYPVKLADSLLSPGELVILIGDSSYFKGTVIDSVIDDGYIIKISKQISYDPSVGPVINVKGEVVGILSFYLKEKNNYSFVLSFPDSSVTRSKYKEMRFLEWKKNREKNWLETYQGLILKGKAFHAIENFEEALLYYKKALRALENNNFYDDIYKKNEKRKLLFKIGFCNVDLKNYEEAEEALKQAIRLEPDDTIAGLKLGIVYILLGRKEDAEEALKQAIHFNPDDAEAYLKLGIIYTNLRCYEEAKEKFKQAIQLDPDYAEAYLKLGVIYILLEQDKKAEEIFKKVIHLNPNDAELRIKLGAIYTALGQNEEAIEAYKQAIRLNPDYAEAYLKLGMVYSRLEHYEEAIEAYKQAIRLNPNDARAHLELGVTYLLLEDKDSALDEYKILKKLDRELANEFFELIYK